jgi:hypothetical protein
MLQLPILESRYPVPGDSEYGTAINYLNQNLVDNLAIWGTLLSWAFVHSLGRVLNEEDFEGQSRSWIDEWLLGKIIAGALRDLGLDEEKAWRAVGVVKLLTTHQRWFEAKAPDKGRAYGVLESWLQDGEVQGFLQVNRYQDVLWFDQEAFDQLLWWMLAMAAVTLSADSHRPAAQVTEEIVGCGSVIGQLLRAGQGSEYQVEKLLAVLEG